MSITNSNVEQDGTATQDRLAPSAEYQKDGTVSFWYPPAATQQQVWRPDRILSFADNEEPPQKKEEQLTRFQVSFSATSIDVAANLNLGSIFSSTASYGEKAIFFDAVANTDYYGASYDQNGKLLYSVRHGIGVRLAVRASNLKNQNNLSYAGVAAQARFSGATVAYQVQGIGIPPSLVQKMLGAVPTLGNLTDESRFLAIDKLLRQSLPDYLESSETLTTSAYPVVPPDERSVSLISSHRALNFAMTQIARRVSLAQALDLLKHDDALHQSSDARFVVLYTYSKIAGITDPTSTLVPSDTAHARAYAWVSVPA